MRAAAQSDPPVAIKTSHAFLPSSTATRPWKNFPATIGGISRHLFDATSYCSTVFKHFHLSFFPPLTTIDSWKCAQAGHILRSLMRATSDQLFCSNCRHEGSRARQAPPEQVYFINKRAKSFPAVERGGQFATSVSGRRVLVCHPTVVFFAEQISFSF